jgi:hypothetical protein
MSAQVSASAAPQVQEEGVLRDVLDELDKERSKRAELEAKIKSLEVQQQEALQQNKVLTLQYEVEEYKKVITALTSSKPALASKRQMSSIPLHMLRLLEITPWDPRVHDFIFQTDTLYEWQIYAEDQWQSQLKYFPTAVRNLSIVKSMPPTTTTNKPSGASALVPALSNPVAAALSSPSTTISDNTTDPNNLLAVLAGASALQGKQRYLPLINVMTDPAVSKIYHTPDHDYPLPQQQQSQAHGNAAAGATITTWEWVDVWHPQTEHGWAYGATIQQALTALPEIMATSSNDTTHPPSPSSMLPKRLLRCRPWNRQRVLTSYPNMCEATKVYLSELASRAQRDAQNRQLSQQLNQTQHQLLQSLENLKMTRAQLMEARRLLQQVVMNRNESPSDQQQLQAQHDTELIIEFLAQSKQATGTFVSDMNGTDACADHVSSNNVSLSAVNTSNSGDTDDELKKASNSSSHHHRWSSSSSTGSADLFDWKRLGRGALMDRIKLTQHQHQQQQQQQENS